MTSHYRIFLLNSPSRRLPPLCDRPKLKGQTYGTIICDLEASTVVDLLPEREAATMAAWLLAHPGVEVISR